MTCEVAVPSALWRQMSEMEPDGRESAGIALAQVAETPAGRRRLLVQSLAVPQESDYDTRTRDAAVLSASFLAPVVAGARSRGQSVIFFHTHPFSECADFSVVDDEGERVLQGFLARRIPGRLHASIVIGREGSRARTLGTSQYCNVVIVGETSRKWTPGAVSMLSESPNPRFDRQVRVFGPAAQESLSRLRVGIVGLGGTGSVVAQELAHLGVSRFLLMDPDVVEPSNLNRVVGAEPCDGAGARKLDVAERMIRRINPESEVELSAGSVLRQDEARRLLDVDAVFACTDSHGSRYVLNQLAYQYLVPVFDVGVAIVADGDQVTHVVGRTQLLAPGLACLTCARTLDPEQVRRDLLSDFERQQDPYVMGARAVPQPAVISLNAVVSSLAVTQFLGTFAGIPAGSRHQVYDALRGMVRSIADSPLPGCVTCSTEGAFAQGDSWPAPGRMA